MSTSVRALVVTNVVLVATVIGLIFVAMPQRAEASKDRVIPVSIEFASTIPCERQGWTASKKAGTSDMVVDEDMTFGTLVEVVERVSSTNSTLGGTRVVTGVTPTTKRMSSVPLYGCVARFGAHFVR